MSGTLTVQTIQGPTSGANANKVIIPAGQTLDASAGGMTLPAGVGGKILQVVSTTKTDTFSTTAGMGSPVQITGLTATITPTSTSSKILVMYNVDFGFNGTGTTIGIALSRNGSSICIGDAASVRPRVTSVGHHEGSPWNAHNSAGTFLDSPNTTSATTYGLKIGNNGNSALTIFVNRTGRDNNLTHEDGRSTSTITVMEIAG
jgi:hypothetical protein